MSDTYVLPEEAFPVVYKETDLDAPYWEGTRQEEIRIQRCNACRAYQWGPDVICHHCHSFNVGFEPVAPRGTIFSWQRTWHPIHPALVDRVPYVVLVVELDEAPGIYLLGNRVGDQKAPVEIDAPVEAVFEHHADYTLVQWRETAS